MNVRFDPASERATAERILSHDLGADREAYLPAGVGDAAVLMLESTLFAWLVGMESGALESIARIHAWLADSIDRGEVSGDVPLYRAMRRQHAYALSGWLLTGETDRAAFRETVRLREQTWDELSRLELLDEAEAREYLGQVPRDCVASGDYRDGVAFYKQRGGLPVTNAAEVVDTPMLGYLACRLSYSPDPGAGAWREPGERVLSELLPGWITSGLGITAVSWLRLVFFDSGATDTPSATIRRAYELLPGVEPPRWE